MSGHDRDFMAGLLSNAVEMFVARLKDEGLVHDERPLLTLEQAAARLGISRRVVGDLIKPGSKGERPALATVKVIPEGHKGVMIEPREIDRYLEERRRATWVATAERGGDGG